MLARNEDVGKRHTPIGPRFWEGDLREKCWHDGTRTRPGVIVPPVAICIRHVPTHWPGALGNVARAEMPLAHPC